MEARDLQKLLAGARQYTGGIDGDIGPKTLAAVDRVLRASAPQALKWSDKRQLVAAAQVLLAAGGWEPGTVDGYEGDNTREALSAWSYWLVHGTREALPGRDDTPVPPPPAPRSATRWPRQSEMQSFFGKAGGAQCTAGVVDLPVPFRVAWNLSQRVRTFRCHELVATALESIYSDAVRHYGEKKFTDLRLDVWGGCYNYRKMRGGTSLSVHAYGAAVDHDPENNQLRWGRDRAEFARPEYEPFWKIVESQGAVSLGRTRNYDWMHFQFARL